MAGSLLPEPKQQFLNDIGAPLFAGKIFTYEAGTLTPKATYQDQALTIANMNPVIANARGEVVMYGSGSYRIVLQDLFGSTIYDRDNVETADAATLLFKGELALPSGAGLIGWKQAFPSAKNRTVDSKLQDEVHFFDFITEAQRQEIISGATSTGFGALIQAAIDSVCPMIGTGLNAGHLIFDQRYPIRVDTPLNITNSRAPGTRSRDFFRMSGFNFIAETGDGNCVMELTGSQWLCIDGLIMAGQSNRSTVGIMQALSQALPQTQNQEIAVQIFLHDDKDANGGLGTVGLWNFGSEETTYDSIYIQANTPLFCTAYSNSPNLAVDMPTSFQAPLAVSHSCGVNTFTGETFLVSLGRHFPSLITEDVNSMSFENVYMSNVGEGGGNTDAWWVYGGYQGGTMNGTIEQHSCLVRVQGSISGLKGRFTFGAIHVPAWHRIELVRGGQGNIISSEINLQDNSSTARPLFKNQYAANEQVSCHLNNVEIFCNTTPQYLFIPENVLWNKNTGNLAVSGMYSNGDPYSYAIKSNGEWSMAIRKTTVFTPGSVAAVPIFRFVGPSAPSNANSLSATVRITGMAATYGPTTGSSAMRYMDVSVPIILSNVGAAGVGTVSVINQNGVEQSVSAFTITGLNVTNSVDGPDVVFNLLVGQTGSAPEPVEFHGNVEMLWSGNESRAPSLMPV